MVGWDPEGMRSLGRELLVAGAAMDRGAGSVRSAVAGVDRHSPVPGVLGDLEQWSEQAAADLATRAAELEAADRLLAIEMPTFRIGGEIGSSWLAGETAQRIVDLEHVLQAASGMSAVVVEAMSRELRELRRRRMVEVSLLLVGEPDPRLEEEMASLIDSLGLTPRDLTGAIDAMARGLGPEDTPFDRLLFTPAYLASYATEVEPALEALADLDATIAATRAVMEEYQARIDAGDPIDEVIREFAAFPHDFTLRLHELSIRRRDAQDAVDEARSEVARAHVESAQWFLGLPLSDEFVGRGVGAALADAMTSGVELPEIAAVLDRHPMPELAAAFFDRLGPAVSASLPDLIADAADGDRDRADELLRQVSEALGRGSRHGLAWTGGDLIGPDGIPVTWYEPAELLRYGDFDPEFLASAATALTVWLGEWPVILFGSPDPMFGEPPYGDPRTLVYGRVAESTEAARLLVERLERHGLLPALLEPRTPAVDDGRSLALLLAALAGDGDATLAVMKAVARNDLDLSPGAAAGAVALLDGQFSLLVPTGREVDLATGTYTGPPINDYDHDPRLGTSIDEADVDRFLAAVLEDPVAAELLLVGVGVHLGEALRDVEGRAWQSEVDELGALVGRIVRIRTEVAIESGQASDRSKAIVGQLTSVLAGVAVGVATGGVGTMAALAAGAAGDLGVDVLYDELVPIDGELSALRDALSSDEFALEFWRFLTVSAIWQQDPGFFGSSPPPHVDADTLVDLWGPTVGTDVCIEADPEAREAFYAWLHELPDDVRLALDAIADTGHSRFAEEARLRGD